MRIPTVPSPSLLGGYGVDSGLFVSNSYEETDVSFERGEVLESAGVMRVSYANGPLCIDSIVSPPSPTVIPVVVLLTVLEHGGERLGVARVSLHSRVTEHLWPRAVLEDNHAIMLDGAPYLSVIDYRAIDYLGHRPIVIREIARILIVDALHQYFERTIWVT